MLTVLMCNVQKATATFFSFASALRASVRVAVDFEELCLQLVFVMLAEVGVPVKADASFSVSRALQLQLPKQLAILEEVSEQASREYSLERALDKMQVGVAGLHPSLLAACAALESDRLLRNTTLLWQACCACIRQAVCL